MRFLVRRIAPQYASPSMRREWIEMILSLKITSWNMRLPPCGGSGLKWLRNCVHRGCGRSPSMRREWIEMCDAAKASEETYVSLHAEGVD